MMSNNNQKTDPEKVRINEGEISPPPVRRPNNDNPKTNNDEK